MNTSITATTLARKLWLNTALVLSTGIFIYSLFSFGPARVAVLITSIVITVIGSVPAFAVLLLLLPFIRITFKNFSQKITALIFLYLGISALYGIAAGIIWSNLFEEYAPVESFIAAAIISTAAVFAATLVSFLVNHADIKKYFLPYSQTKITYMETELPPQSSRNYQGLASNKIWIKGLLTAGLILLMLIPTMYVSNLVQEREKRQEEVKKEVSSKWAGAQTITFPYLFIPYHTAELTADGKTVVHPKHFMVLPEDLNVTGDVSTEQRQRSIYSVLLYKSDLIAKGNFIIHLPDDANPSLVDWNAARICLGISDFKGIEEKITAKFNNAGYELTAGLPLNDIDNTGLSAPIILNAENIGREISFQLPLKIKGSDQLHFVPLAGNSHFVLRSGWSSPSFDGNTLPGERQLSDKGFEATWNFNKANLPFNTMFKEFNLKKDDYAFGVSLLQPTDQYAKTLRCVKYAILFIGLSFSLFFIVEVMQKKPFHPVQYVLVGMALIVFYTLLLSISEFLLFDIAYLIASSATVSLITLYAKSHFKSWKVAGVFAGVIGFIYAFIFVLIRLEDTALLIGSIGLFIILALGMYTSRKINWYGNNFSETAPVQIESV